MTYTIQDDVVVDTNKDTYSSNATIGVIEYRSELSSYSFQGSVSGYVSGGIAPGGASNIIEKFPFSTDSNSTDVGDLSVTRNWHSGQSSTVSGYNSGGTYTGTPNINVIDKFPFAANANASDVGDLSQARGYSAGHSSELYGWVSAGLVNGPPNINVNTIERFPFSSDAGGTDTGDLTRADQYATGQSSSNDGYTSGGTTNLNTIDKFPFATGTGSSDVGDLTAGRYLSAGQSSATHGYTSGGMPPTPSVNIIDKFPFASSANATDVGDLTLIRRTRAGMSSTTSGYTAAGYGGAPKAEVNSNIIDKFSFASDANATDVGDTLFGYNAPLAGQQI